MEKKKLVKLKEIEKKGKLPKIQVDRESDGAKEKGKGRKKKNNK